MDRRQVSLGFAAGAFLLAGGATGKSAASGVCDTCPSQVIVPALPLGSSGDVSGIPFEWIQFSREGQLTSRPTPELLSDTAITDFIVISHGWNTDAAGAWRFYEPLLRSVAETWGAGVPIGRKYAILGVQWPSREFSDEQSNPINRTVARHRTYSELNDDDLRQAIQKYADFTGSDASRLWAASQTIAREGLGEENYWALVSEIRASLTEAPIDDAELLADLAPFNRASEPNRTQRRAIRTLIESSRRPFSIRFDPSVARAQRLDPDQHGRYRGLNAFFARLLQPFTYYEMKRRAGRVGGALAERILSQLNSSTAARVHLIGHSFGARLVTSSAYNTPGPSKLRSLTLLQGAFSHNALAQGGAFQHAHDNISGPTLITHTHKDEAVTIYYAIASSLSGDTTRKIGGADSQYGAIGANGALGLGVDAVALADTDAAPLTPGKVHNMDCSNIISCHMDVINTRVAGIVARALLV